MVAAPKFNFFAVEGALLIEAHKLRSLDTRVKDAKKELGKFTTDRLRVLESQAFSGQQKELNEYLGVFRRNYFNLLRAYTDVVKEIERILNLVSQAEYEDLLAVEAIFSHLSDTARGHPSWFKYNSDDIGSLEGECHAAVDDLEKKLVDEYSLKQTVGAHGRSRILQLRAFLRSRGIIERYAEAKAMQAGRVYRQAKKKSDEVREKITRGENFLHDLKDYFHLLEQLNLLLHTVALDILMVHQKFRAELDGVLPYYRNFINKITVKETKEEILTKLDEFYAQYRALQLRLVDDPQWANVKSAIGENSAQHLRQIFELLHERSIEGPLTEQNRKREETRAEAQRIKEAKEAGRREREAAAHFDDYLVYTPSFGTNPNHPARVPHKAPYVSYSGYGYWVDVESENVYTGNGDLIPGLRAFRYKSRFDYRLNKGYKWVGKTPDIRVVSKKVIKRAVAARKEAEKAAEDLPVIDMGNTPAGTVRSDRPPHSVLGLAEFVRVGDYGYWAEGFSGNVYTGNGRLIPGIIWSGSHRTFIPSKGFEWAEGVSNGNIRVRSVKVGQRLRREEESVAKAKKQEDEGKLLKGVRSAPGTRINLLHSKEIKQRMVTQQIKRARVDAIRKQIEAFKKKYGTVWSNLSAKAKVQLEALEAARAEAEQAGSPEEMTRLYEQTRAGDRSQSSDREAERQAAAEARARAREETRRVLAEKWGHVKGNVVSLLKRSSSEPRSTPNREASPKQEGKTSFWQRLKGKSFQDIDRERRAREAGSDDTLIVRQRLTPRNGPGDRKAIRKERKAREAAERQLRQAERRRR